MNRIINHNLTQLKLTEIGENNMKIPKEAYVFNETLKAEDFKFGHKEKITLKEVKQIKTQSYGEKFVGVTSEDKQVFINSISLANLVKDLSDDTQNWLGVPLLLEIETSERTKGKKTIVLKKYDGEEV